VGRRRVAALARAGALALVLAAAACTPPEPALPEPALPEPAPEVSAAPWIAASQAGATFRAVGNEPGWLFEVYPDSLVHVTNYGEARYRFVGFDVAGPRPIVYEASADGHRLSVSRSDAPCHDDMSGEPFEATVVLTLDGHTFRGCGRSLGAYSEGSVGR
jgi:putative lipoprotein